MSVIVKVLVNQKLFLLILQVAAVSGNKELAELIRSFRDKDIGTLYNKFFLKGVLFMFLLLFCLVCSLNLIFELVLADSLTDFY